MQTTGGGTDAIVLDGWRPDPDNPPVADRHTRRPHFSSYPIVFSPEPRP